MSLENKGLMIELQEDYPCIIRINGIEVKLYLAKNRQGRRKMRVVNEKNPDVEIIGPHIVRKISQGIMEDRSKRVSQ